MTFDESLELVRTRDIHGFERFAFEVRGCLAPLMTCKASRASVGKQAFGK